MNKCSCKRSLLTLPTLLALSAATSTASLAGKELVAALQQGGYVILIASSAGTPPDPAHSDPGNLNHERQLDEVGRTSAAAMGDAFQRLRILIGEVMSSPTYRARETAQLANFGPVRPYDQLGDAEHSIAAHSIPAHNIVTHSMAADPSGTRGAWLRSEVAQAPKAGTDTLIITHAANIREAFPTEGDDLADGEALIVHPDGNRGASIVARVEIQDWSRLADAL